MNLSKLMITLTLGCLSIVAIAALALLPITDGICEWTGDDHHQSYTNSSVDIEQEASPDAYEQWSVDTQKGRGWFLNASLASGPFWASASVSPSIYGLSSFDNVCTYGGTANVRVYRESGSVWCDICQSWYSIEDTEISNKDQERTLTAKVVSERWYTVNGVEIDEKTGQDITAGASATTEVNAGIFEAQVEVNGSYTWKRSDGKKFRAESKKVIDKFVAGPSKGQYKSLYTHGLGNGAELDFIFEGHSGGNSVSWAPSGSGSGQGSGGD